MVQPYKLSHLEQIQSFVFVSKKTGPPESTKFRFVGSNRWFGYFMIFPICRHSMQEQAHINQYRYIRNALMFVGELSWRNSERSCYCDGGTPKSAGCCYGALLRNVFQLHIRNEMRLAPEEYVLIYQGLLPHAT